MLRAAAVGGGAYMAGKHNANRQAEQSQYQQDQDDRISNLEAQQAPPTAAPPAAAPAPAAATSPMIDQLNQLAALHTQGVLSDEEFAAAKAKLLGT